MQDGESVHLFVVLRTRNFYTSPLASHITSIVIQLPMWQTFGIFAHHRASCAEAGFWQECTEGAQICGETGARVSTNVFVRDLVDNQLAIDTTLVSSFSETAEPSEVPLQATVLHCGRHARKVRTYPGLARDRVWVRFVAVAVEVGSWQSSDSSLFLGALARARAVSVRPASLGQVLLSEREVARVRGSGVWCFQCQFSAVFIRSCHDRGRKNSQLQRTQAWSNR